MKQAIEPQWEAKPDYDIFSALADKLGIKQAYTEGRSQMDWIRKFYNDARQMGATLGQKMPDFDTFWKKGYLLFRCLKKTGIMFPLRTSVLIRKRTRSQLNPGRFSSSPRDCRLSL